MSAVNSSSGDRDGDMLRRVQRVHEPSMEEILASIRDLMVDEREAEKAASSRAATSWPPQIVYSKEDSGPQRAADENPKPSPGGTSVPAALPAEGSEAKSDRGSEGANLSPEELSALGEEEPLLSPEASQTVTSAFEVLSANLAARGAEIAEGMAREMLRPMLKAWLDENLPGIVERLVRAEIERVARGIR
jgi:uncharacterized protein